MGNANTKHHYETASKTGTISLCNCSLDGFPTKLRELSSVLRQLNLSHNKFHSLPACINTFTNLKLLNVNHNKLESLPEDIGKLQKLENLSAISNRITTIPMSLSSLTNLKEVHLSHNQISEFPVSLCNLKHLSVIDLSFNKITVIPDCISRIYATELNLNQNQINLISPEIAKAPKLKILKLECNCLMLSAIPNELLCDSNVSSLSVEGNLFDIKDFEYLDGYKKYMVRYTETKKKMF